MSYVSKWGKEYRSVEEFAHRFATWLKMDEFINEVNDPTSEYTHTAAHNRFSTWTSEEFGKMQNLQKPL